MDTLKSVSEGIEKHSILIGQQQQSLDAVSESVQLVQLINSTLEQQGQEIVS